jgi:hypothetical protein
LPITFVTDDAALVDALSGSSDPFVTNNMHGAVIGGESMDLSLLHDDVQSFVRSYMNRERTRVLTQSRGLTETAMKRAGRLAASLELRLGAQVSLVGDLKRRSRYFRFQSSPDLPTNCPQWSEFLCDRSHLQEVKNCGIPRILDPS